MSGQDAYPYGWYSQLGPSRSRPGNLLRNHGDDSLDSYLPRRAPSSAKDSRGIQTDTGFPSPLAKKPFSAYDKLRSASVELADGNTVAQHTFRRERAIPCRTIPTETRTVSSNPRADAPSENLSAPQGKKLLGDMLYPNMLETNYGNVPRYSVPAWMAPPGVQAGAASSYQPYFQRPCPPPYPVTPELRPISHGGNCIYSTIGISSHSLHNGLSNQQSRSSSPSSLAREISKPSYEIDGREITPKTAPKTAATFNRSYQPPNKSRSSIQCPEEASHEFVYLPHPTELAEMDRHEPTFAKIRDGSYTLKESEDVSVTLPCNLVSLDQDSPLLGSGHLGDIKMPRFHHHAQDQESFQPAQKSTEEHDSFYTPANGKFYLARPYTQLKSQLKEFRLLRVHPRQPLWQHYDTNTSWNTSHASKLDKNQEILACEIEKTSLMRVGDNYTTLSYCAGDPHKTAIILVDGIPFNAFANLEHAIDRLWAHWTSTHPREEPLLLWADQISINQSDKDERSQQVQIMRDIYRRSSETYVCLSVPTIKDCLSWTPGILACSNLKDAMPLRREADQGVKLLQHLLLELLRGGNKGAKSRAIASEPTAVVDLVPNDEESLGGVSITTFQTSLASFITNSWWRRYV